MQHTTLKDITQTKWLTKQKPVQFARQNYFFILFSAAVLMFVSGCSSLGYNNVPPIKIPEIVNLSKQGVSPQQIIEKIKNAGMVYRLNAKQVESLHKQGVSNEVINYMQQVYRNVIKNQQQLEDDDQWINEDGWWYGGSYYGWPDEWLTYYYD